MTWHSELETHLKLTSGWLCLDFINTNDMHARDEPIESLHNYNDLVSWAVTRNLLIQERATLLQEYAVGKPDMASRVLKEAIELRESLYQMFSAIAAGERHQPMDLGLLNVALKSTLPKMKLVQNEHEYSWIYEDKQQSLDSILWPIVYSTTELLTRGELERVGECADEDGCGWLFFDKTKNHSRRWCDMKDCGNRNKVRRYYQRKAKQVLIQ